MKHHAEQFEFSFVTWLLQHRQAEPAPSRNPAPAALIKPPPARPRQEVQRPVHARGQLSLFSYGK